MGCNDYNKEFMFNISVDGETPAGEIDLNYFLVSQTNELEKEFGFKHSYGVMIEENYHDVANISTITDLCPVKEEVIEFINSLQKNQVTSTTLHDVAQDWVATRQ